MLMIAFVVLTGAVALGLLLIGLIARADGSRPSAKLSMTHGALGAGGLGLLLLALREPAHGVAQGAAVFGWDAAGLMGAALVLGIVMHVRRPGAGLILVLHGTLAIFGYVILSSYISF